MEILVENFFRLESLYSLPVLRHTRVLFHAKIIVLDPSVVVPLVIIDYELVKEICLIFWNLITLSKPFDDIFLIASVYVKPISSMALHAKKFNNFSHLCRVVFFEM